MKRKLPLLPFVAAVAALAVVALVAALVLYPQSEPQPADKSRIGISVASSMKLADNGLLHVNFIVPEGNNGLSERLEVVQDGRVVYATGVVPPGYMIDYGASLGAHEGPAQAIAYAVDDQGNDYGNAVTVDVEIVSEA